MSACLHGFPETDCFVCAAPSPWCTTREAGSVLARTAMRVAQLCRAGVLDAQPITGTHGMRWRITRVSVLEYLRGHPRRPVEGGPPPLPPPVPVQAGQETVASVPLFVDAPVLGRWQRLTVEHFVRRANKLLASL